MNASCPALFLTAPASGQGKTTLTAALARLLRRQGKVVRVFKTGPDYLDPQILQQASGQAVEQLDMWMAGEAYCQNKLYEAAKLADLILIEGVMGMFDGTPSSADLAARFKLPMVIVMDVKGMAQTAAVVVAGLANYRQDVQVIGMIANHCSTERHRELIEAALPENIPLLFSFKRDEQLALPERHLGLVTAEDHELTPQRMNILADWVENAIDLDALLNILPEIAPVRFAKLPHTTSKVRIAVARDKAFCFYYPENLEMLEESGAEIVRFSPLNDAGLPENIDGIYMGGGYPELHATAISGNVRLKNQILEKCREGMPIYGECGGFMVLCKTLVDKDGREYPMAGCFDFTCRMTSSLRALGYREMTLIRKTILGEADVRARGHEFHYSQLDPHEQKTVYQTQDRSGSPRNVKGFQVNRCLGSYLHLHFKSQPSVPRAFIQACLKYRSERITINAAP